MTGTPGATHWPLGLLTLWGIFLPTHGTVCYSYSYVGNDYFSSTQYCDFDCCGYSDNKYCCAMMGGGAIAGSVIGSLVGLSLFIALIVFLCYACKKRGRGTGQVIYGNAQQPSVAIVNAGHNAAYQGAAYPPPRGAAYAPPPGAVYPPPPGYSGAYPPTGQGQFMPPPPEYTAK